MKKIVVIGGGTGSSVVLSGLKKYDNLDISAVVNMTDDGGSNAVVRDELGILPLSDLRKSILALADENFNDILRELFVYRFHNGKGLSGHTLGNLLMAASVDVTGSEIDAIKNLEELFNVKGRVIPVTTNDVRLIAEYGDGTKIVGEHLIDEIKEDKKIEKFGLDKFAQINKEARDAIENGDFLIIGPGDIYTSLLACIVVNGVAEAIQKSRGKLIFVSNLMTKKGQTRDMSHSDIVKIMEEYIGRRMDRIVINNGEISEELIDRYTEDGENLIEDDLGEDKRVLRRDIVANTEYVKDKGDKLKRSLVRHDPDKVAGELYKVFMGEFISILTRIFSRLY